MDNKHALSQYRLEQAAECLDEAKILLASGKYKGTANRSYYCVFNAMRSILALEEVDFKKHRAVISYFRQNYIKTGTLEEKLSTILRDLFEIRTASDYDDGYIISKAEITEQLENAEYFLNQVKKFLDTTTNPIV